MTWLYMPQQAMGAAEEMGWPTGWTGFAFAETEWSRWLQRMRCELSRLGFCLPAGDEVAIGASELDNS